MSETYQRIGKNLWVRRVDSPVEWADQNHRLASVDDVLEWMGEQTVETLFIVHAALVGFHPVSPEVPDMSTKPETTMSAEVEEMNVQVAIGSVLGWFADDTTLPRDIKVALTKLVKTSRKHLSCAQTPAQMVAALIAEGGETWTGDQLNEEEEFEWSGRYLVYGPIPAEEETTT